MGKLISRAENYSEWYNQLVQDASLAENSSVRGCMVIKPYGYAIWENIRNILDAMFKSTGHTNAYFPLFIPKSFFSKEASHVEGFAKECAIVTHSRLMNNPNGKGVIVDPSSKLEEELVVRPTSETIIWDSYRNWIHSYRDLPLLINQWANVVRWEMRTRIFLRSMEFLWQEGHTAHATAEEAEEETKKMLMVYSDFVKNFMGIHHTLGQKAEHEKFAGAVRSYSFEPMMQDGKALQAGTSHNLGQNFAKAFDVQFTNKENKLEYVYATSWGVSTRLMGGLIMSHSDDQGLVLPPALAPIHLVIVPVFKTAEDLQAIQTYLEPTLTQLKGKTLDIKSEFLGIHHMPLVTKIDTDDQRSPGWKYNEYELKGVPLRIAVGARDMAQGQVELYRRDTQQKQMVPIEKLAAVVVELLADMQTNIYAKHKTFTENHTHKVDSYAEFKEKIEGNFLLAHWDGTTETALQIQEETKATIRCIPFDSPDEAGVDMITGKPSTKRVLFAKAY
ncbi:hypothetical protein P148_SR1C00001G0538 [candidate division SR1 bacterium RAAC1_SR1_1]|nr:hypothetical protein P148_SR1C00001G0538 [candidate division SR1 bacterium RAAC1_SR1_1]